MAKSRFEYVKSFELSDALLPETYLIVRLDGHRFTKFVDDHGFIKPNDEPALRLMAACARRVMTEWGDAVMAYGQSDEFSFLLPTSSKLYNRRASKISSLFASLFTSSYVLLWPSYFPETKLLYPPSFDGRVVAYPTAKPCIGSQPVHPPGLRSNLFLLPFCVITQHVRDYFSWRQADCHVNNLYNTCFWSLVHGGTSKQDAQLALKGTSSGDKNELLFSEFGINYNNLPQHYRKGFTLYRSRAPRGLGVCSGACPGPTEEDKGSAGQQGMSGEGEGVMAKEGTGAEVVYRGDVGEGRGLVVCGGSGVCSEGRGKMAGTVAKALSAVPAGAREQRGRKKGKGLVVLGTLEEAACDLIGDRFWEQHPHILGES
ncbi:unnamed protein product [Discosporangium mesarthrocarpum]